MREQSISTRERSTSRPALSGFDADENPSLATVACGPYAEQLPVGRMTVGEVRARFRSRFDIDPRAVAVLDGRDADEQTVIRAGQVLTFIQRSGEKGS